ncbi:potassium-transporting ATPase subunit KdpC [Sphingomonas sanguinis]|jgi:K+-transporting ATPase ATPase C chain|uniref:Potassium-transporting ATPase KdpC subunit n=1 Tax=Sphingomonas sanguinis TaxID=33051 RepID=A0A7Y7QTF3_9SPHN|nr:potassium-transporting ATPase subunit KdpC [Sphingomonas sanguinis]MBZ6381055.1 potassium-transporting ATPase subunit KdpC [Sphingomonas sanguinis]NNG49192.1 potassium-transporting ATPase subunit KdpC [Sphingomonas sanguinis]NNG55291.1 potassium-transporting ATPase subunit KdpC [Sphingomonas sanguinis]NVP30357.1 potassium-transporting ATPase subunit KdpC [Sphingomonas sanguinis]
MGKDFTSALRPAIVMTILFAALLGIAYPLAMTGIGQAIFPHQANGSLVEVGGRVIGSEVVGQAFVSDRYFQTRPSAAGKGYDGLASSGSNLGPTSQALADRVKADVAKRRAEGVMGDMPADLVTASGSGLDPDLSPAAAQAQTIRIARVRNLPVEQVRGLVVAHTEESMLGDPHVNVLALNRALDAAAKR